MLGRVIMKRHSIESDVHSAFKGSAMLGVHCIRMNEHIS
jgi:hypothetical protein